MKYFTKFILIVFIVCAANVQAHPSNEMESVEGGLDVSNLIYGGYKSALPYVVRLVVHVNGPEEIKSQQCTGTIINYLPSDKNIIVLTALHCFNHLIDGLDNIIEVFDNTGVKIGSKHNIVRADGPSGSDISVVPVPLDQAIDIDKLFNRSIVLVPSYVTDGVDYFTKMTDKITGTSTKQKAVGYGSDNASSLDAFGAQKQANVKTSLYYGFDVPKIAIPGAPPNGEQVITFSELRVDGIASLQPGDSGGPLIQIEDNIQRLMDGTPVIIQGVLSSGFTDQLQNASYEILNRQKGSWLAKFAGRIYIETSTKLPRNIKTINIAGFANTGSKIDICLVKDINTYKEQMNDFRCSNDRNEMLCEGVAVISEVGDWSCKTNRSIATDVGEAFIFASYQNPNVQDGFYNNIGLLKVMVVNDPLETFNTTNINVNETSKKNIITQAESILHGMQYYYNDYTNLDFKLITPENDKFESKDCGNFEVTNEFWGWLDEPVSNRWACRIDMSKIKDDILNNKVEFKIASNDWIGVKSTTVDIHKNDYVKFDTEVSLSDNDAMVSRAFNINIKGDNATIDFNRLYFYDYSGGFDNNLVKNNQELDVYSYLKAFKGITLLSPFLRTKEIENDDFSDLLYASYMHYGEIESSDSFVARKYTTRAKTKLKTGFIPPVIEEISFNELYVDHDYENPKLNNRSSYQDLTFRGYGGAPANSFKFKQLNSESVEVPTYTVQSMIGINTIETDDDSLSRDTDHIIPDNVFIKSIGKNPDIYRFNLTIPNGELQDEYDGTYYAYGYEGYTYEIDYETSITNYLSEVSMHSKFRANNIRIMEAPIQRKKKIVNTGTIVSLEGTISGPTLPTDLVEVYLIDNAIKDDKGVYLCKAVVNIINTTNANWFCDNAVIPFYNNSIIPSLSVIFNGGRSTSKAIYDYNLAVNTDESNYPYNYYGTEFTVTTQDYANYRSNQDSVDPLITYDTVRFYGTYSSSARERSRDIGIQYQLVDERGGVVPEGSFEAVTKNFKDGRWTIVFSGLPEGRYHVDFTEVDSTDDTNNKHASTISFVIKRNITSVGDSININITSKDDNTLSISGTDADAEHKIDVFINDNRVCSALVKQISGEAVWNCSAVINKPGYYIISARQRKIDNMYEYQRTNRLVYKHNIQESDITKPVVTTQTNLLRGSAGDIRGTAIPGTIICITQQPTLENEICDPIFRAQTDSDGSWSFSMGLNTKYAGTFPLFLGIFIPVSDSEYRYITGGYQLFTVREESKSAVLIKSPENGATIQVGSEYNIKGLTASGTIVCLSRDVPLSQLCDVRDRAEIKGYVWTSAIRVETEIGDYFYAVTEFDLQGNLLSTSWVNFEVVDEPGDITSVSSPQDNLVINQESAGKKNIQLTGKAKPNSTIIIEPCPEFNLLCDKDIKADSDGNWDAGPIPFEIKGNYQLSVSSYDNKQKISEASVSYSVVATDEVTLSFKAPLESQIYTQGQKAIATGVGKVGTSICVTENLISLLDECDDYTIIEDGSWTWDQPLKTDTPGDFTLYVSSFDNDELESQSMTSYRVVRSAD